MATAGDNQAQFKRDAADKLGTRRAEALAPYACSRLHGMLYKPGRSDEFDVVFPHIQDHFYSPSRLDPAKRVHTKFIKKYCSKDAVKKLLLEAANAPSYARLTRLSVDRQKTGNFAIKIVRQFGFEIGEGDGLNCLIIFFDEDSKLITAYPISMDKAWEA